MEYYWLLTSHITAFFPIYICYLNYKKFKKSQSIFVIFNIIFNTLFSVFYHTYDYDNIKLSLSTYHTWAFLDYVSSSAVIFLTILYCLRLRSHNIYLFSYIYNSFFIIIYLILNENGPLFSTYYTVSLSTLITILNYKILIFCFKEYIIFTIILFLSIFIAVTTFYLGVYVNYQIFHPIWHIFIHTSAGLGCMLKNKIDLRLIDINNENIIYNRTPSESL